MYYFITRYKNQSMMMNTAILIHRLHFPLPLFMLCWWRHNRLLMTSQLPDNCDATTWQVISNSLDIHFIHGGIHNWSCKKIHKSQCWNHLMPLSNATGLCNVGFERWPHVEPSFTRPRHFHVFSVSWWECYACGWGGHLSEEMTPASVTVKCIHTRYMSAVTIM